MRNQALRFRAFFFERREKRAPLDGTEASRWEPGWRRGPSMVVRAFVAEPVLLVRGEDWEGRRGLRVCRRGRGRARRVCGREWFGGGGRVFDRESVPWRAACRGRAAE